MRTLLLILALGFLLCCYAWERMNSRSGSVPVQAAAAALEPDSSQPATASNSPRVDFQTQIKPILEARCQPCHFSGGQMYKQLPFDRAETVTKLNTKLFTRIKNENERRLIRDFLAQ
jgi:hypothetical protein